jgi:transcriptional regulator with XRE-family HTH domain
MSDSLKEIGKRIRQIRGKKSLVDFGKIIGISKTMVSYYEDGSVAPRADTLQKIAEYGDVSFEWLFTGKEFGTEISAMVTGKALGDVELTDEEMKDIPAPFRDAIKAGNKLSLANQYRIAADILDKIGDLEAEEQRKKQREEGN